MEVVTRAVDEQVRHARTFLENLLADYHPRNFAVRFWDGSEWPAETPTPAFTLVLKHPGALRRMFQDTSSDLALGEAYIYDDFDIEGDIEATFPVAEYLMNRDWSLSAKLRLGWELLHLPGPRRNNGNGRGPARLRGRRHSIERDKQAVTYHYNVSNDFYALWLDRNMVYSCAYFESPDEDLDTAQERKLDYICRKLRLRPGERLLDIGCGWGGLVIHAAKHYGVEAVGITLSEPQAEWANRRIREEGLEGRARVEVLDYREMTEWEGFDKLVSVGMFEHVGEALLPTYFEQAFKLLKPGGVFLNHGIARDFHNVPSGKPSFTDRYVFPDGELVPISTTLHHAEAVGFEVRDVESLREHYALTLRHWVRRLEAHHDEAVNLVGETTYRVWRLFMSGSAYGFDTGRQSVYQTLLVKRDANGRSGLPLTRKDWYR